ncbi:deoxyribodipyrimidine photo-lyase isoform X1 [Schistocerca piceifrons]|uniref:deoxyribodipyrimidine photo-lyase isoform X1 n=2 Tax=Schistocerca piceifrons TaxID=274613 RepID=UPI001F5EA3D9|nr:deoxyribodipyrimidine photo-lyase isoform X1 [Schistocerca piceifrons]
MIVVSEIVVKMSSGSPSKKLKTTHESVNKSELKKSTSDERTEFIEKIRNDRVKAAPSINEFKFNKKRVQILSKASEVPEWAEGVVYWMSRDQRVQDNWALLYAQKLALKTSLSLHVCFCLVPKFLDTTYRHYSFLLKGLQEVEAECKKLAVEFHLLLGEPVSTLPQFLTQHKLGAVVTDFSPLREPRKWVDDVKKCLPKDVPLCQVDAHNIVPCWIASDKLEYAARTIRNKINSKLQEYLTQYPPVVPHPHSPKKHAIVRQFEANWVAAEKFIEADRSVQPVTWATAGTEAGLLMLHKFCTKGLKNYGSKRNDPTIDALSNLSPWFHFGHISVQRAILEVKAYRSKYTESVDAFCEEAIIRRELSDNFCFYNDKYDSIEGTNAWALKTLNDHRKDKRSYIYTCEELEKSLTHDDLWNSAQIQLVKDGKIHGFMRMYWAKKILEWTPSPEEALRIAIYLNDRYSLDGGDPNGFVGCMWSVCGIHDQGWLERPVFGKIRYMNYEGCKRKFNIAAYKWVMSFCPFETSLVLAWGQPAGLFKGCV